MKTNMMSMIVGAVLALPAWAQELVPGKYSGTYQYSPNTSVNVVLDIKSVENGVVSGTASSRSTARQQGCSGEYQISGTFKGNTLRVRSTEKGGAAGDCTFSLSATLEGDKLRAKRGQNEFDLTR